MAMEKNSFEKVSENKRVHWINIMFIWLGSMICIPSLLEGGAKVEFLSPGGIFWSSLIGYMILAVIVYFQGSQGADLGLPTDKLAESSFGKKGGSFIVSALIALSLIGWFGIQTAITGKAIAQILAFSNISVPVAAVSIACGILMMTNAIYGYNSLVLLNNISVPALLILCGYGVYSSYTTLDIGAKVAFSSWFEIKDSMTSMLKGIDFTVGGLIVGAVISANYSRYSRSRKDTGLSGLVGIVPAGVVLAMIGAMMTIAAGESDFTIVLGRMGYPVLALVVLILATWSTNVGNAYSGGLALTNMLNLKDDKRYLATCIAGGAGIILAITGILDNFINFLLLLTKGITPVVGVMFADYWIVGKGKASSWKPKSGWYLPGVIAWFIGFTIHYFIRGGSETFNAILFSGLSYLLLVKVLPKKSLNQNKINPLSE
ncbi:MAG: cytosine permease [Brevinema sp.]